MICEKIARLQLPRTPRVLASSQEQKKKRKIKKQVSKKMLIYPCVSTHFFFLARFFIAW